MIAPLAGNMRTIAGLSSSALLLSIAAPAGSVANSAADNSPAAWSGELGLPSPATPWRQAADDAYEIVANAPVTRVQMGGPALRLYQLNSGEIVCVGRFTSLDNQPTSGVATWAQAQWIPMETRLATVTGEIRVSGITQWRGETIIAGGFERTVDPRIEIPALAILRNNKLFPLDNNAGFSKDRRATAVCTWGDDLIVAGYGIIFDGTEPLLLRITPTGEVSSLFINRKRTGGGYLSQVWNVALGDGQTSLLISGDFFTDVSDLDRGVINAALISADGTISRMGFLSSGILSSAVFQGKIYAAGGFTYEFLEQRERSPLPHGFAVWNTDTKHWNAVAVPAEVSGQARCLLVTDDGAMLVGFPGAILVGRKSGEDFSWQTIPIPGTPATFCEVQLPGQKGVLVAAADGNMMLLAAANTIPTRLELLAYPNPTCERISFELRGPARDPLSRTELGIVDVNGRKLRQFDIPSGSALVVWDGLDNTGRRVPSGRYFARLAGESIGDDLTVGVQIVR